MQRNGISSTVKVAAFVVFIVILAVILILANTGVIPGIGEGFQNLMDTVIDKPLSMLEGLFG